MFSARQAIADADLEPFPFEDSQGVLRELPHMKALTLDQGIRILRHGEIKEVVDELVPGLGTEIATWPAHVIEDWVSAWRKHSGVTLPGGEPGKSSNTSPSSLNTAAP